MHKGCKLSSKLGLITWGLIDGSGDGEWVIPMDVGSNFIKVLIWVNLTLHIIIWIQWKDRVSDNSNEVIRVRVVSRGSSPKGLAESNSINLGIEKVGLREY